VIIFIKMRPPPAILKIGRGIERLVKKMHQKALTVVCGIVEKLLKVVTQFCFESEVMGKGAERFKCVVSC
jgi:hypothetical protein